MQLRAVEQLSTATKLRLSVRVSAYLENPATDSADESIFLSLVLYN
jgi:hypothetical protein